MKRKYSIAALLMLMVLAFTSRAQVYTLNDVFNDSTVYTCAGRFVDNGGLNGNYSNNQDRHMTFCSGTATGRVALTFEVFNLGAGDTMEVSMGRTVDGMKVYCSTTDVPYFVGTDADGQTLEGTAMDTTGCLTVRFKADNQTAAAGWRAALSCEARCQDLYVALDTFFIKYDSLGNMSTRPVRDGFEVDTASGDTTFFNSIDFCIGDSVVLIAKPQFPYNDQMYHQDMSHLQYYWSFGDGSFDTVFYNERIGHKWETLSGYNLNLALHDTTGPGCNSKNTLSTRVRIAKNPIKTVANLSDMCSGDRQQINVGYGANSTIIIDSIEFNQQARQEFDTRMFLPDGTNNCYESPVTFNTFSPGATIESSDEVMDICIQIEHSFVGDLGFYIECPNGQVVTLKYNTHQNGSFLGIPNENDGGSDSNSNPIGTCWTYCFSNIYTNSAQGVIVGSGSSNHMVNSGYSSNTIDSTHYSDTTYYFQTPVQGLTVSGTTPAGCTTPDLTGFDALVGCSLNGEWILRVCDNWGSDNGWVCGWWMDLGKSSATDWDYQVPLDTVAWSGPFLGEYTSTSCVVHPPVDSCGDIVYDIDIIDDFGCHWEANTNLSIVCTPIVDLGPDRTTCEKIGVQLDAGNPGATAYSWEPNGETTRKITANPPDNETGTKTYIAQVTNFNGSLYCYGLDTVNIMVYPAANASFTTDNYPLEGCEPFHFKLQSTSVNAEHYYWTVGDETSESANPEFTFPYGQYDLDLMVESEHGCRDTIHYDDLINVFKNPTANFGWNPSIPYASDPTVTMVNKTTPEDPNNRYRWQFQTNKYNSTDIENVFGETPTYTWHPQTGQSVAGDYAVFLDAYTVNNAPSGYVYECHDTITKVITIINDNLMFPTVITPNGDGVNDVFFIHNLIDGQAFPDNELSVFNRYGKRIYYVQDLRNADQFWNPDETKSPTGTYFYRFIGHGPIRDVEFSGSVEVLRDK